MNGLAVSHHCLPRAIQRTNTYLFTLHLISEKGSPSWTESLFISQLLHALHIFRVFEVAILVLAGGVVVGLDPPLTLVDGLVVVVVFALVGVVDLTAVLVLADPLSINPPARSSTHIAENSGCDPHEMPATL